MVSRELVVSGCDAPILLDLVEEPFDQVACRYGLKQIGSLRFRFGWNVCPRSLLAGKRPDPVSVVSTIREQHGLWEQRAEENRNGPSLRR
jgi:hypothetical protein